MLLIVALLVFAIVLGGLVLVVRVGKSLEPRQRVVLVVVAILGVIYFGSKMMRAGMEGYRQGTELRQQGGR